MSFSTLSNVVTMLFCGAVLVQSIRLIRCLRAVKGAGFGEMVAALDTSTTEAKRVLADLRETLRIDCAANARVIANGEAMREELTVMAGIADAVAERILGAVEKSNPRPAAKAPARTVAKPKTEPAAKPVANTGKPAGKSAARAAPKATAEVVAKVAVKPLAKAAKPEVRSATKRRVEPSPEPVPSPAPTLQARAVRPAPAAKRAVAPVAKPVAARGRRALAGAAA